MDVAGDEILTFVRTRLAHYKCPKQVDIVADLPKSGSGKILKRELRDPVRSPSELPYAGVTIDTILLDSDVRFG